MPTVLNDPKLEALLDPLHQASSAQDAAITRYYREERTGPWAGMEPRDMRSWPTRWWRLKRTRPSSAT